MGIVNENQLPKWENQGIDPGETKKTNGWQKKEKPPANWFNWLFNRIYSVLQALNNATLAQIMDNGNLAGGKRVRNLGEGVDDEDATTMRQQQVTKQGVRQMDGSTLRTPLIAPYTQRYRVIYNAYSPLPVGDESEGMVLAGALRITGETMQVSENFNWEILGSDDRLDIVAKLDIAQTMELTFTPIGGDLTVRIREVFGYFAGTSGNATVKVPAGVTVIYERSENVTFVEDGGTVLNHLWYNDSVRKFDLENMAARTVRANLLGSSGIDDVPKNEVVPVIKRDEKGSPYEPTRSFDHCFRWGPQQIHNDVTDAAGNVGSSINPVDITEKSRSIYGLNVNVTQNADWYVKCDSGWTGIFFHQAINIPSGVTLTIHKTGAGSLGIYAKKLLNSGSLVIDGTDTTLYYEERALGFSATPEAQTVKEYWYSTIIDNDGLSPMPARSIKANPGGETEKPTDLPVGVDEVVKRAGSGNLVSGKIAVGNMADMGSNRVRARSGTTGQPQDIPLLDNHVLKRDGDVIVSGRIENNNIADMQPYSVKVRDSGTPGIPEDKVINTYNVLGRENGVLKSVPGDVPMFGRVGVSIENELISDYWLEDSANKLNRHSIVVNKNQNTNQNWFIGDGPANHARGTGRPVLFAGSGDNVTISINRKSGAPVSYGEVYLDLDARVNGALNISTTDYSDTGETLYLFVSTISGSGTIDIPSGVVLKAERISEDTAFTGAGSWSVGRWVSRPVFNEGAVTIGTDGLAEVDAQPLYNFFYIDAANHDGNGIIFLYINATKCPPGTQVQFFVENNTGIEISVGTVLDTGVGELERINNTSIAAGNYSVVSCVLTPQFTKNSQTWGGVASFLQGA